MPKRLSPAARVERLRLRYGSHDKLATALGTRRQTVIRWEKGGSISPNYARKLAELDGCNPEDYRPAVVRQLSPRRQEAEILSLLERLEARVARIEKLSGLPDDEDGPQANGDAR